MVPREGIAPHVLVFNSKSRSQRNVGTTAHFGAKLRPTTWEMAVSKTVWIVATVDDKGAYETAARVIACT